jgi:hypothetical protein
VCLLRKSPRNLLGPSGACVCLLFRQGRFLPAGPCHEPVVVGLHAGEIRLITANRYYDRSETFFSQETLRSGVRPDELLLGMKTISATGVYSSFIHYRLGIWREPPVIMTNA